MFSHKIIHYVLCHKNNACDLYHNKIIYSIKSTSNEKMVNIVDVHGHR